MSENLPTLYEYYTSGGTSSGLSASQPHFLLNNKPITLYSGALHYFRVPPPYWSDRLRKMRAAGLNCVETYIPWNLHEPIEGQFDFGQGGSDFQQFLDLEKFLKTAQKEDLFVIVRPGPYICAEIEFGGLPSWLLRSNDIRVRTSDPKFIEPVRRYFRTLCAILSAMQFSTGGPIVAFQIENEYGNIKEESKPIDTVYLETLKEILIENGIVELLFTSDTPSNGFSGTLPGVLATANFQEDPVGELSLLQKYQPNRPLMVMEYWTGWFDHWAERHHTRAAQAFGEVLEKILEFGASVNMYMFHGGTNWGFLNGGNVKTATTDNSSYQSDTTSYDYDAPLAENGAYTDKYYKVKELIEKYNKVKTKVPPLPKIQELVAYKTIDVEEVLPLEELVKQIPVKIQSKKTLPMELLDINNNSGQSYGYILYRIANVTLPANSVLKIEGNVRDTVVVVLNGKIVSKILENQQDLNGFGYWRLKDSTLDLGPAAHKAATLDLLVENFGRINYGKLNQFNQFKGLLQNVLINDRIVEDFQIVPLEFQKKWIESLKDWRKDTPQGPALFRSCLEIATTPKDTYIDTRGWTKGVVVVNGFILGRYLILGPQHCLYLPGTLLQQGRNEILFFEHFTPGANVKFTTEPVYELLQ